MLVALVLLTAGLAGCIGTTEGSNEPLTEPEASEEELEAAQASPGERPTANTSEPELVEETRELTWDGYMPEQSIACAVVTCVYQPGPTTLMEERDNVYEIGTNPMPVAAEFTLTYDDPEGSAHEMLFGIVTDSCQDGCHEIIWKEGTSGMTISVEDFELSDSDGFAVTVHHTYNYYAGNDLYYSAGPPIDFTVEGTYDVLVPQP